MILHFDINKYIQWYANWLEITVEQLYKRGTLFTMLDDWLDIVSIPVNPSIVGKKVYYSVDADHESELTDNTWLEGCRIKYDIVEDLDMAERIITIGGKRFYLEPGDTSGLFFDDMVLCFLTTSYDGTRYYQIMENGDIVIPDTSLNSLIFLPEEGINETV